MKEHKNEIGTFEALGKKGEFEKRVHKTPRGGDYSILYCYNDNWEPCSREQATQCKIYEMTNDDKVLNVVIGRFNAKSEFDKSE